MGSQTVDALHHLKPVAPKEGTSAHFGDSAAHKEAISLSHIGATLTRSLQHHDSLLEDIVPRWPSTPNAFPHLRQTRFFWKVSDRRSGSRRSSHCSAPARAPK